MSDFPRILLRILVLGMTFDSALTAVSELDAERETDEEVQEALELWAFFDRSVRDDKRKRNERN